jgi:hypothetical protein
MTSPIENVLKPVNVTAEPVPTAFVICEVLPRFNKIEPVRTALNLSTTVDVFADDFGGSVLRNGDVIFNSPDTTSSSLEVISP